MRRLVLLSVLLSGFAGNPALSEESDVITLHHEPAQGETVYYRIRKSDATEGEGARVKPVALTDVSIEFLGHQKDGSIYRLAYLGIRPEDPGLAANPVVMQALGMLDGLSFDYVADETGSPLAVRDLQKVKDWFLGPAFDLMEKGGISKEARQKMTPFFENLTAEGASELLLKDIGYIFSYTGTQFSRTRPYEAETRHVWNLAGTELVTTIVTEVVKHEDDVVSLRTRSGYTRESVMNGINAMMTRMLPDMTEVKKEKMLADMRQLDSFDVRKEIDADLSVSDGWPIHVTGVAVVDTGKTRRTVTHQIFRMSREQALAENP